MTHATRRTQSSCTSLAQLRAAAHDQFQVLDGQRGLGAPHRANRAVFPQQEDVLRLVTDAANRLKAGTLGGGISISGELGCGKSTALQAAGRGIEATDTDILFVRVNMRTLDKRKRPLQFVLSQIESKVGVEPSDVPLDHAYAQLQQVLEQHNKKAVIVFDRFEFHYEKVLAPNDHGELKQAKAWLEDIGLLGDGTSPSFLTIVCSSSEWVQTLLRGDNSVPALVEAFPLLQCGTNLNGRQFRVRLLQDAPVGIERAQAVQAWMQHVWTVPPPINRGVAHPAAEAVFWSTLAKGACLLVGGQVSALEAVAWRFHESLRDNLIPSNASLHDVEAVVVQRLLHAYSQAAPHEFADPPPVLEDYAGVSTLLQEVQFQWAVKNELRSHPNDKQRQLAWLVRRYHDVTTRMKPLTEAEFAAVWASVRDYGTKANRAQIGDSAEACLEYMRSHFLLWKDESGGIWPKRVHEASMAPRGAEHTWYGKLCVRLHRTADAQKARFSVFKTIVCASYGAGGVGLMMWLLD